MPTLDKASVQQRRPAREHSHHHCTSLTQSRHPHPSTPLLRFTKYITSTTGPADLPPHISWSSAVDRGLPLSPFALAFATLLAEAGLSELSPRPYWARPITMEQWDSMRGTRALWSLYTHTKPPASRAEPNRDRLLAGGVSFQRSYVRRSRSS